MPDSPLSRSTDATERWIELVDEHDRGLVE
jgi:hypothetical protein